MSGASLAQRLMQRCPQLGLREEADADTDFLRALYRVDDNMAVNIEHEDVSLGRIEGLRVAADVLLEAERQVNADLTV